MKLTDLLNAHHPLEIEYQLLKSYPETHQHILSYRKVLAALKQLPVEETSTYIVIKAEHDEMGSQDRKSVV